MPRVQFSDVTPPENKRSIRNIPIPNSGKRKVPIVVKPQKQNEGATPVIEENKEGPYEYYYPKREPPQDIADSFNKSKRKPWMFGAAVAIVIAIFIVGMMTVFASATIDITPKSQAVDVNMKIAGTVEKEEGAVRYEVVKLSKSKTAPVAASGEEVAEIKASSKIVIYNNFSSDPQRLIVRTRFESPEGLIYRIPESVVIPGKTIKDGKETPGSIEVEVFADEAGEKYNIKKTDFVIPGFKNDAIRYKTIYARSSTDMDGGFIGKRKTVLPADKAAALQGVDSEVQADLERELQSKVPEGLTLLSGGITYKSKELPPQENGSSVSIGKEITAYAIMLNSQDLSGSITNEYISKLPEWDNIKSAVKDFSLLAVASTSGNFEAGGKISLQINGKASVLADIDTGVINQRLLGAPRGEAAKLIDEFAGISNIKTTIRPVWKRSFPDNPSKIYVQMAPVNRP